MASCHGLDGTNTEMEAETNDISMDFSDFVKKCVFPQSVLVTDGNFLSKNVQISDGDVLLLKSCDDGQLTLSYRNESSHIRTEVSVDLDYSQKFNVLPPKDTNTDNRTVSMVVYPTLADLILDCPTYFEATASFVDSDGVSVNVADRFWFVGIVTNPDGGVDKLKVRNEDTNILILSLECRGNFCPLTDEHEYTIRELLELAPVPRRLKMVTKSPNLDNSSSSKTGTLPEGENATNEYSVVIKASDRAQGRSVPSSLPSPGGLVSSSPSSLPDSFGGIIHLRKYESAVTVSPYNDTEITWTVPVSANLKVRAYSQNDYEVPAPRTIFQNRVPLPLPLNDDAPKFRAPSVPHAHQPLVPINVNNFADIYCSTFPVKAKIIDISGAHPFLQEKLKDVNEIIVYRLDEAKRLYVKDVKSDTVYSLSHDLKLSFIEYPEKFQKVSELLHLPMGTDITVLEDIAADFPIPFSLRFGDIVRLTSNTPYFVKMKHSNRDCQVIKCERIDSNGGENTKLKLPMDLEMNMVMVIDSNSRRMLALQDLLTGVLPIPTHNVASVPDVSENSILKELPVDLRILKSMKETCLVVASAITTKSPSVPTSRTFNSSDFAVWPKDKKTVHSSSQEQILLRNIGLPVTSEIVLAFRDSLDMFELDVRESEEDYIRVPLEKLTFSQFEERERLRKLTSDYEDIEFGSSSTLDESGAGSSSIPRANSTGVLDKKQKNTTMDKVMRLSRALNPKHWRHSKAEPEPLPHPSVMGLMTLALRPKEEISNDYHHTRLDSISIQSEPFKCASSASSEEDENFYEDVEIGPIRSSTIATTSSRQTGAFLAPTHRSLPPQKPSAQLVRNSDSRVRRPSDDTANSVAATDRTELPNSKVSGNFEDHSYDVPTSFTKAKNWATNFGNNIGERFSNIRPRYDVPKSSIVKEDNEQIAKTASVPKLVDRPPPSTKPPLPPSNTDNKIRNLAEKKDTGSLPIPPARRKREKSTSKVSDVTKNQSNSEEQEEKLHKSISSSSSLNESISSNNGTSEIPKPKPRGGKILVSPDEINSGIQSPLPKSRLAALSVDASPSAVTSESSTYLSAKEKPRPKPPPKPKVSIQTTV